MLSCLNLLGNPPVQGPQEVDMPRPAQGPNSQEADKPRLYWGFDLQEAVTHQLAWGSAPWTWDAWPQVATVLGRIKLQKDSPLRKSTHGNWRRPFFFSFFFLFLPVITVFQMGNNQSTSWQMHLRCILDNWKLFDPLSLRRSCLKFFCATAWTWYPLGDKEQWPEDESLN